MTLLAPAPLPLFSPTDPAGLAVVGLDLSLTATGIAYASGETTTIDTRALRGTARLAAIREQVAMALDVCDRAPDLVVIEGYSYGSKGDALFQLGELGGVVRMMLADEANRFLTMGWAVAPPASLKRYATGDHQASKTAMVVAARERLGFKGLSHDQADAAWLRAAGLELMGAPLVKLPKLNRSALEGVEMMRPPTPRPS